MAKEKVVAQEELEIEKTYEEVKEALDSAADALLDDGEEIDLDEYDSEPKRRRFEDILKMYGSNKLVVPIYQRKFVWNPKKQKKYVEDALRQKPTPSWMIAEYNDIYSIVDGLQRFTTLSFALNDPNLTKEQKAKIRKYKVDTTTINNIPPKQQRTLFQDYNSGIVVSGAIKQRANLNEKIEILVTTIVADEFPENLNPKITFNKSAHHDTITENALLAVSGISLDSNRPEALAKLLNENEDIVIENQDKAREIIKRIISLYQNSIPPDLTKRSLNANFISILIRVIVDHPEITNSDIIQVISYIFAKNKAVDEYGDTTGGGSGDVSKCVARYNSLLNWLINPPELEPVKLTLKQFIKRHKDANISDLNGKYVIDFNQLSDEQKQALCDAQNDGKQSEFDKIIEDKYNEIHQ